MLSNTGPPSHGHLNGFVSGRQKTKQYAQSVALSLLKLIPNEQPEEQQHSSTRHRQSTKTKQSDRNNTHSSFMGQEDAGGSYQHTIFNPGAVNWII